MYHSDASKLEPHSTQKYPFQINVVTPNLEHFPLPQLYFCDACSKVQSRRELWEDIDSYYCPQCLENMPSSEAMAFSMRCSKCWECPICSCTTTINTTTAVEGAGEQKYYLACSFCHWSSRKMKLEAAQPEKLISRIYDLEKDNFLKKKTTCLVEAYRTRSQELQREQQTLQRMRRRSLTLLTPMHWGGSGFPGAGGGLLRGSSAGKRPVGPWRVDDLEKCQAKKSIGGDLRQLARGLEPEKAKSADAEDVKTAEGASEAEKKEGDEKKEGEGEERKDGEEKKDGEEEKKKEEAQKIPILPGLSVDELLRLYTEKPIGGASVVTEMQKSIDESGLSGEISSLRQRLGQAAYGYFEPTKSVEMGEPVTNWAMQNVWTTKMLPVRTPLLTKRSRRCRPPCNRIVVKPQINPCSNPPFQKNNVAVAFIPRCTPFTSAVAGAAPTGDETPLDHLAQGKETEVYFLMSNPLDTEVEITMDPTAFNGASKDESNAVLQEQQNCEVLTSEFSTTVARFNDLADVHEVWGDDPEKNKELAKEDNKDCIHERRLHRLLIRLRLKPKTVADNAANTPPPWVWFCQLGLSFKDRGGANHTVNLTLRFQLGVETPEQKRVVSRQLVRSQVRTEEQKNKENAEAPKGSESAEGTSSPLAGRRPLGTRKEVGEFKPSVRSRLPTTRIASERVTKAGEAAKETFLRKTSENSEKEAPAEEAKEGEKDEKPNPKEPEKTTEVAAS